MWSTGKGVQETAPDWWYQVDVTPTVGQRRRWATWSYTGGAIPALSVASLPLPVAVAAGATAAIIRNPTVTRRFWK